MVLFNNCNFGYCDLHISITLLLNFMIPILAPHHLLSEPFHHYSFLQKKVLEWYRELTKAWEKRFSPRSKRRERPENMHYSCELSKQNTLERRRVRCCRGQPAAFRPPSVCARAPGSWTPAKRLVQTSWRRVLNSLASDEDLREL